MERRGENSMIRLVSLEVDGFKNLRIKKLNFIREGTILFMGLNESGKSSVFEAIFFALTSQILEKKRGFVDAIAYGKNNATIDLIFEKNGIPCRIKKIITRRGSTAAVGIEFWKYHDTDKVEKISGTKKELDEKIEEFLDFDAQILLNSCFVKQKGLDGFMGGNKRERERIVNKLLNMERITEIKEAYLNLKNDLQVVENYFSKKIKIEENDRIIGELTEKLQNEERLKKKIGDLKDQLLEIENFFKVLSETEKEESLMLKELEEKENILNEKREILSELNELESVIKKLNDLQNQLRMIQMEREKIGDNLSNSCEQMKVLNRELEIYKKNEGELKSANESLKLKEKEKEDYDNYKKIKDKLTNILNDIRTSQEMKKGLGKRIFEDAEEINILKLRLFEELRGKISNLQANCEQIKKTRVILTENECDLNKLRQKRGDLNKNEKRLTDLNSEKIKIENELNSIKKKLEKLKENKEKHEHLEFRIKNEQAEFTELENEYSKLCDEKKKTTRAKELNEQLLMFKRVIDEKQKVFEENSKKLEEKKQKLADAKKAIQPEIRFSQLTKLLPISLGFIALGILFSFLFHLAFVALIVIGGSIGGYLYLREKKNKAIMDRKKSLDSVVNDLKSDIKNLKETLAELQNDMKRLKSNEERVKNEIKALPERELNMSLEEFDRQIANQEKKKTKNCYRYRNKYTIDRRD